MTLQTDVVENPAEFAGLHTEWDRLLAANSDAILGHDATSGAAWFAALADAFPATRSARIVVVRDAGAVVALLPVAAVPTGRPRLGGRRLFVPTVLYGGRNGFLMDPPRADILLALLEGVRQAYGPWQLLHMWIVVGSESEQLLQQACAARGYRVVSDDEALTPHIPLQAEPEAFAAHIAKGIRQRIKAAPAKFAALGELRYQELGAPDGVEPALDAILAIERGSWKHEAGTAISCHPEQERFYRALLPRAIAAGQLFGHILYLNTQPIAYSFGLVSSRTFISLKHSQVSEFERLSPSHLVKMQMVSRLRAKGITTYDFMGGCEPHKLQWSDATGFYGRRPVWIYSPSLWGRVGYAVHLLKRQLLQWRLFLAPIETVEDDHVRR